jgi:hypothetical protein
MPVAAEIDRLYQLPLADFTPARNALAKTAGADAFAIRALEKPSISAWAVNQVYWRRRKIYDALVAAAARVRAAHLKQLSGKRSDVAAAETAHQAAIKTTADEARAILAAAADPATPATMAAIVETLQTLPTDDRPGRLTRPLKPRGFEALAGLVPGAVVRSMPKPTPRPVPVATSVADRAAARAATAEGRARARARSARVLSFEKDTRAAEKAAEAAADALASLRKELAAAEKEHAHLEGQLAGAASRLRRLRDDLGPATRAAQDATHEADRLRRALSDVRRQR